MKISDNDKYMNLVKEVFGTSWETRISIDLRVGVFLLDSVEKTVILDDNISGLLGISEDITFDEMQEIIKDMDSPIFKDSSLKLLLLDTSADGIKAGFVTYGAINNKEHLPMNVYSDMKKFFRLIEENKFTYAFQPIISAYTGEIVAYEALMRTDPSIGFGPFQILKFAQQYKKLYDVEKATVFNTCKFFSEHRSEFENRQLFINIIPGYFLTEEDFNLHGKLYGEVMKNVVVELTEQAEISDSDLALVKERVAKYDMQLAIDDYGTGYSNTSNLLRYNPRVVKIDRSLLVNIDSNNTAKSVVESTIEFLHRGGFIALAEGVETTQELRTVIELGADLIQGYYIAMPSSEVRQEISASVVEEIVKYNVERTDIHQKLYYPEKGEEVFLSELSMNRYTGIVLESGDYVVTGVVGQKFGIPITIKDDSKCQLEFRSAGLASLNDLPTIGIGKNCNVTLTCCGENTIDKKGIYVPSSSEFTLKGAGSLTIHAEQLNSYGIGASCDSSFGNINIALSGLLSIYANGETAVGIGGGHSDENSNIIITSGELYINSSGATIVGIGCFSGTSKIEINDVNLKTKIASPKSVTIGIIRGRVDLKIKNYKMEIGTAGVESVGIGAAEGGVGSVLLDSGELKFVSQSEDLCGIGTRIGEINCEIRSTELIYDCEGEKVTAIGDREGCGAVVLYRTNILSEIKSKNQILFAVEEDKISITY